MTSPAYDLAFLKGFFARPLKVASPVPSGRKLAAKIAEQVDADPGVVVVEFGPGTGAVTRALRKRGVAERDLVLIESDPQFVQLLRAAFPQARVIGGDAFGFAELLGDGAHGLGGIVSGLPVIGLSAEKKRIFVQTAIDALAPGNPFIQFSYSRRPPLPVPDGVAVRRAATVWQNIWPMRIWVFRSRKV